MKSNSKKKLILAILVVFIVFSTINITNIIDINGNNNETIGIRDKTNIINPKLSGAYTESFIHIDGSDPNNWSNTKTLKPWCRFIGGKYVIENVTIDASSSPTGSGILIENSKNDYFVIRNCTVYNAYDTLSYGYAGIKLENTNNGTLINNNCSDTDYSGIYLVNDCDNNTISGNIASTFNFGSYPFSNLQG